MGTWNNREVEELCIASPVVFVSIILIMRKKELPLTPAMETVMIEQAASLLCSFAASCDNPSFQYFKTKVGEPKLREIVNAIENRSDRSLISLSSENSVFPEVVDELLELATDTTIFHWTPSIYFPIKKMQAVSCLHKLLHSQYDTYTLDYIHEKHRLCSSDAAVAAASTDAPLILRPVVLKDVFDQLDLVDAQAFRFAYRKCEQLIRQKIDKAMNKTYVNCAVPTFSHSPYSFVGSKISSAVSNKSSLTMLLQQLLDKPTIKPAEIFDLLDRGADINTKNSCQKDVNQIARTSKPVWPIYLLDRLSEIAQRQQKLHAERITRSDTQNSSVAAERLSESSAVRMFANDL